MAYQASFEMENRVVPNSYKQAMKLPDKQKWKTDIFEELDSLENNQVFEIIERSDVKKDKTLVGSRWVLTQKFNELGELKRYKARCVAQGFKQKEGIDYQETFSPTGRLSTLRYLTALAAETGEEIRQADFVTAYLNATLEEDETVYMHIPEGFKEWLIETKPETLIKQNIDNFLRGGNNDYIMKLKKSLYGLKQSARSWYNTMSSWLEDKGFQISEADPCLFIKNGTILFVWVDDIIVIGPEKEQLLKMIKQDFKIKDLGKAQHVLGMKITHKSDGSIRVDQEHYVKALLTKYKMEDAKTFGTPIQSNIKLEKSTEEEIIDFKKTEHDYRAAIGCLNYLSQCTRPDITYTVGIVSQFLEKPGIKHWQAFKRCLRYLKGTQSLGLEYSKGEDFNLVGYSDSSWAENDLKKSTSGFTYFLGKNLISWRSKKISAIILSSTESEYRAYLSAAQESKWIRKMLEDTYKIQTYSILFSDNQGAIKLASNPVFHSRTKHIDVHYNYIREAVKYKEIVLEYIPTANMTADIMTKALDRVKHIKFSISLSLSPPTGLRGGVEGVIPVEGNTSSNCISGDVPAATPAEHGVSESNKRSNAPENWSIPFKKKK